MVAAKEKSILSQEIQTVTPVEAAKSSFIGKRAVVWNPAFDLTLRASVGNATPVRSYHFSFVKGYHAQVDKRELPIFETLDLKVVGRNWVDADLIERAIAASKLMPGDPFNARIKSGAIWIPKPVDEVLSGTLSDYDDEDTYRLIETVYDKDILLAEAKAESRPQVVQVIRQRISDLESGNVR